MRGMIMVLRAKEFVLLMAVLALCGCGAGADIDDEALDKMAGGKREETVAVSGTVSIAGSPAGDVNIYAYTEKGGLKPVAETRTKDDGTYCWTTYVGCDGLPAGKYTLAFTHVPKEGKGKNEGEDLLKGKFKDPKKTGFALDVVSGTPQTGVDYDLK